MLELGPPTAQVGICDGIPGGAQCIERIPCYRGGLQAGREQEIWIASLCFKGPQVHL